MDVSRPTIYSDSHIVILQVTREYQVKDTLLQKHLAKVKDLLKKFDSCEVRHVAREKNVRANILSKLASTKPGGNNKSLIQETLKIPSIAEVVQISAIEESSSRITSIM